MSTARSADGALARALSEQHLLVCVGSGGVGKTTTAAALGIQAALSGRRVLVITIDPARRLANALGLEEIGNQEHEIPREILAGCGRDPQGTLHAMMLDTRTTFDDVIRRVSPDEATYQRVLRNRVYRHVSESLAASQEYMASEKLWDVHHSGRYDLIVLDTPPMKNALDFLEASGRLTRFLDEKVMKWFLTPEEDGRVLGRVVAGTSALAWRLLGHIFGREFLSELSEFFQAFKDLYRGFRERADGVSALLKDASHTRFLVVTSPQPQALQEAAYFADQLRSRALPGGLFVVNQMGPFAGQRVGHGSLALAPADRVEATARLDPDGRDPAGAERLVARLEAALAEAAAASDRDLEQVEVLWRRLPRGAELRFVPRLPSDVHDLPALGLLGRLLLGQDPR